MSALQAAPRTQATIAPLLEVRDLKVEFRTGVGIARALDGVSFQVGAGDTLAVLGESGFGKSVTAQAIMALLPRAAGRIVGGSILYDGNDLARMAAPDVRKLCATDIAMVFQDPLSSLNPVFKIGYQLAEPFRRRMAMGKTEAWSKALDLLKRVGIPDAETRIGDYPHQFSGGQRQRIMIAMAIALRPKLLIADEPTTALDVTVQKQIMSLLADLQAEKGMAMILISHDLGAVAQVAQRVAIMYAGRIVETGPARENPPSPAALSVSSNPMQDRSISTDTTSLTIRRASSRQCADRCRWFFRTHLPRSTRA